MRTVGRRSGCDPAPELRQAGAAVGAALQASLQFRDGFRGCQEGVDLAFGDVEAVAEGAPPRRRQPGRRLPLWRGASGIPLVRSDDVSEVLSMKPETAEKVKHGVWGLILGAVIAMTIGFQWGGWSTRGTSKEMTDAALLTTRAAICVA